MVDTPDIEASDEFRGEYDLAWESWLRRRLRSLCSVLVALEIVVIVALLIMLFGDMDWENGIERSDAIFGVVSTFLEIAVICVFYFVFIARTKTPQGLIRMARLLVGVLGGILLVEPLVVSGQNLVDLEFLASLFFLHLVSSLLLPWSPWDSIRPFVPLAIIWILVVASTSLQDGVWSRLAYASAIMPLGFLPGVAICSLRLYRWRRKFRTETAVRGFLSLRRELRQARSIHESLLPSPSRDEHADFDFVFRPMRDLGGDYIHASRTPTGGRRLVLIDVTGHGLASAMTVTRVSGELERLIAETPDLGPAAILEGLNRYMNLVTSPYGVFATAIAVDLAVDDGRCRIANAGHPAALVRRPDGPIERVESAGMMLGALESELYSCEEAQLELQPGSVVLLYTDGASETRGPDGKLLGDDRLEQAFRRIDLAETPARKVLQFIDDYRVGPPGDDVVIATLSVLDPRPAAS